ncbi:MAG: HAMP domain-containing histidine kinase [Clostridia bacterium]|nr:HAMP domain-containing histidine kinase [Clostridia bacterium]
MLLFLETMANSMGVELTSENISTPAKITMLNVLLITVLFTIIDYVRRKLTVERPTNKIIEAGRKITNGDFSVRIPPLTSIESNDPFNEIAECFNKMAQELSSTETLRTDFVANVSHELKTPLSIMQNYGSLLSQPNLDDEKRIEYAKGVVDASKRLANLITNILKLNKLENQQITPAFEKYNLSEQVCECLLDFEDAWEKKEINIQTDIEEDIYISSDKEMMSLVWNNLFSNAIKFNKNGGMLSLSIKREGEYAIVKISDTGCGISPQVGKHMFDKFYQGDTSHATQGNGLGLALVKRVIDITGCDISVESEVGRGTTFTVKLRRINNEVLEEAL